MGQTFEVVRVPCFFKCGQLVTVGEVTEGVKRRRGMTFTVRMEDLFSDSHSRVGAVWVSAVRIGAVRVCTVWVSAVRVGRRQGTVSRRHSAVGCWCDHWCGISCRCDHWCGDSVVDTVGGVGGGVGDGGGQREDSSVGGGDQG